MCTKRQKGFTLIELMIVVAIVAILAAIAYPSYLQQVIKSNRAAAKAQMFDIANRQQQYLIANRAYASKSQLESGGYGLPSEVSAKYAYAITVGSGIVPYYLITFTPYAGQASDGTLTFDSEGAKAPASKW
jgi:type IV pilus assembly protein PilE